MPVKICGRREINFREAFRWLRDRWNVNACFARAAASSMERCSAPVWWTNSTSPRARKSLRPIRANPRRRRRCQGTGQRSRLALKSINRFGDELFIVYRILKAPDLS